MNWTNAPDKFSDAIPIGWLDPLYYDALNALFRAENALRIIVFVALKNALGAKWDTPNVEGDDSGSGTIASVAKRRRTQDRDYGYLGYDVTCPLMYLTAGEMTRLVLSEGFWPHFKQYFSAAKSVVEAKLSEISNIRNRFAHFRPLRSEDAAQVRINATQVLAAPEKIIIGMLNAKDVVPTNCSEQWYITLSAVTNDQTRLRFFQSTDGAWISIVVSCTCAILSDEPTYGSPVYRDGRTTTIISPQILINYPSLRAFVTCMCEAVGSAWTVEERPPFTKTISMFFNREVVAREYDALARDFIACRDAIARETELLTGDNLAHGSIVKPVKFSAQRRKLQEGYSKRWTLDQTSMLVPVDSSHPPEYWGTFADRDHGNLFTDSPVYPWMPVQVSAEADLPF